MHDAAAHDARTVMQAEADMPRRCEHIWGLQHIIIIILCRTSPIRSDEWGHTPAGTRHVCQPAQGGT